MHLVVRSCPASWFFFWSLILIWKCQKCSLNRVTLVPATAIYQIKCPFTVSSAIFLFFGCFPIILDYSLPNLDMKTKYFKTFFLVQKRDHLVSYFLWYLRVTFPFLIPCSTSIVHISVNINIFDAQKQFLLQSITYILMIAVSLKN